MVDSEEQKVWVLTCEQYYAGHFTVIGVFSSKEKAEEEAEKHPDTQIENFYIDRHW